MGSRAERSGAGRNPFGMCRILTTSHFNRVSVLLCLSASPIAAAPSSPILLFVILCGGVKSGLESRAARRSGQIPAPGALDQSPKLFKRVVALQRLSNGGRALCADVVIAKAVQWGRPRLDSVMKSADGGGRQGRGHGKRKPYASSVSVLVC
jgi:hypothetical protein